MMHARMLRIVGSLRVNYLIQNKISMWYFTLD